MSLANLVTLGRLLAVPLVVWLILIGDMPTTFWVFTIAGLSDAVDGYVAKRFDQRSELGALLDPIADKTLIVSLFVTLGLAGHLPNWLVIMVVFRDLLIVGGFVLALVLSQPISWRPLLISKVNTVLQLVLLAVLLGRLAFGFVDHGAVVLLTYCVAATTIFSGAAYLVRWGRGLAGVEAEP
jgi:cardiolipin synthase (CMP-forming)